MWFELGLASASGKVTPIKRSIRKKQSYDHSESHPQIHPGTYVYALHSLFICLNRLIYIYLSLSLSPLINIYNHVLIYIYKYNYTAYKVYKLIE